MHNVISLPSFPNQAIRITNGIMIGLIFSSLGSEETYVKNTQSSLSIHRVFGIPWIPKLKSAEVPYIKWWFSCSDSALSLP